MCGMNSLLMSPAPWATNEPRPAALIDVKKLETPRSASRLPAASPEPPPPSVPPAALFPSQGLLSISTDTDEARTQDFPFPSCPFASLKSQDGRQTGSGGAGRLGRGNRPEPENYSSGTERLVLGYLCSIAEPKEFSSCFVHPRERPCHSLRLRGTGTIQTHP